MFNHFRICKISRSSAYHHDLIKENIVTKLQKLYSLPRNLRAGNKSPVLFLRKRLGAGDLLPVHDFTIERPVILNYISYY